MPCLCLRNRRERGSCRVTSKSVYRLDPLIRTQSQVASHARPPSTVTRLISHKFTSAPAQRTWSSLISGTSQSPPPTVSVSSHAQASYNKPAIQHQRSPIFCRCTTTTLQKTRTLLYLLFLTRASLCTIQSIFAPTPSRLSFRSDFSLPLGPSPAGVVQSPALYS